jgi:hypothetical protein
MRDAYDFVLIDSRTGVTEFGGVVTAQLPDILAFMFTANEQSLTGCMSVAQRAQRARKAMPIDRGALRLLPIPSRFEGRVEHGTAQEWRERFYRELAPFYSSWVMKDVDARRIVDLTTIPHVPIWTFGERLSVLDEANGGYAPDSISYVVETIAALLARDLTQTDVLAESRGSYVAAIQRREERRREGVAAVYLSFDREHEAAAAELRTALGREGLTTIGSDLGVQAGDPISRSMESINRAQHMVVLVGRGLGKWQEHEVNTFRRQSAVDERPRHLLPVVLGSMQSLPTSLLSYRTLDAKAGMAGVAYKIAQIVGQGPVMA